MKDSRIPRWRVPSSAAGRVAYFGITVEACSVKWTSSFANWQKGFEWERHEPPRAGDVLHSAVDLDLAGRELGYRPRNELADGLSKSLAHYRSAVGAGV